MDVYYRDYPAMITGSWGWQVETGTHLLRLICGGVFDRHPRLKIIVGHMGELVPYNLKRINLAVTMGHWLIASQEKKTTDSEERIGMQKSLSYYMHQNVFITTSGVFDQVAFNCAFAQLGIDNILFSVDDPFSDNFEAVDFLMRPNSQRKTGKSWHTETRNAFSSSQPTRSLIAPQGNPLSQT
jgi:predicted TIM-barrel fold metal-dependent hydrolase